MFLFWCFVVLLLVRAVVHILLCIAHTFIQFFGSSVWMNRSYHFILSNMTLYSLTHYHFVSRTECSFWIPLWVLVYVYYAIENIFRIYFSGLSELFFHPFYRHQRDLLWKFNVLFKIQMKCSMFVLYNFRYFIVETLISEQKLNKSCKNCQ